MSRIDSLRQTWDAYSDRERRLLIVLGGTLAAFVLVLPLFLLNSAITSLETENDEIAAALRELDTARDRVAQRQAEVTALQQRYARPAPQLPTYLEAQGRTREITLNQVTNQPDRQVEGYRQRITRATLQGIALRPLIRFVDDIENSPYPLAVERIHIDHFQPGDQFNAEVGVMAVDRIRAESTSGANAPTKNGQ